jgi:hypothetical protein
MKNILAENMLRFGPRNLSESEKRNLRILAEQNEKEWDAYIKNEAEPAGEYTQLFASIPFLNSKGKQYFTSGGSNEEQNAIAKWNIGAALKCYYYKYKKYDPKKPMMNDRFFYVLDFFLTTEPGKTGKDVAQIVKTDKGNTTSKIDLFTVQCYQISNGSFKMNIKNQSDTTNIFRTNLGTPLTAAQLINLLSKSTSEIPNKLISDINNSLIKLGYPAIGTSLVIV